ncbi:glutaredoxin domain-containing protein [Herbiconiux sp. SALV-R1]|uniref:glutaredoxin domain-containing protein n=1 Tax=unclassified Herbiconiux TaxID=2618217 RepID=UPI00352DBFA2
MVTVYGKADCPQCAATRRTLEIKDVPYEYVDVDLDPAAADVLRSRGFHQMPVVVAGTTVWSGFRPDLIVGESRRREADNVSKDGVNSV